MPPSLDDVAQILTVKDSACRPPSAFISNNSYLYQRLFLPGTLSQTLNYGDWFGCLGPLTNKARGLEAVVRSLSVLIVLLVCRAMAPVARFCVLRLSGLALPIVVLSAGCGSSKSAADRQIATRRAISWVI